MLIGLIAGSGKLPEIFKGEAVRRGFKVVSVGVKDITDMKTDEVFPLGKVGSVLKFFKKNRVSSIVMLGKFEHNLLFSNFLNFDMQALSILRRAKDRKPASLIKAFIDFFEEKGFEFIDPSPFLESLLAEEGILNRIKPSEKAFEDGIFGFPLAKDIAEMDIGQTLVVKDKSVVAVEAMEGTQKTIERAGKIAGKGIRVIKVARKKQDFRIDVPAVGLDTLKVMKLAGADALFLEAGKVYIIEKSVFLRQADRYKISVIGLK